MMIDDTLASRTFDTLHMGRSSIDLYSNDVGVPFSERNLSQGEASGAYWPVGLAPDLQACFKL